MALKDVVMLMRGLLLSAVLSAVWGLSSALAADDATIIMYHRFGEDKWPSTNIGLETFDAHLATIAEQGWDVLPLAEIVRRLKEGESLPDKALAITIDDAFLSVYREAFPRLRDYGYPFTLFVATETIDQKLPDYADWNQIREMKAAGVEIGSQTHTHPHMHRLTLDEAKREIDRSNARFLAELGEVPRLFAYPYGEYTPAIRDLVRDSGFVAAFGQASGVAHQSINAYEWPRFAFNEHYGNTDRLKIAVNAKALPVTDITHESMVMETNPPVTGFTIKEGIGSPEKLTCFATGMGKVDTLVLGHRVEIRLPEPFSGYRNRINCTMPVVENGRDTGRWRWFGRQFVTD